jgi:hypothetical protein
VRQPQVLEGSFARRLAPPWQVGKDDGGQHDKAADLRRVVAFSALESGRLRHTRWAR